MKRKTLFVSILIGVLCISLLAGCNGGTDNSKNKEQSGALSGIDFESTEVQQVSETKASVDTLEKIVSEYLEGNNMFFNDERTYEDFVEQIGCDATEYYFDADNGYRVFTWIADDATTSKLGVYFKEDNGAWKLSASGSVNLM